MKTKLSLKDLDLKGKRVLMRVDFNVPLDNFGHITDDTRIAATLPSIKFALDKGASVVLMSHLGRPKGKTTALSLAPCAKRLEQLLHHKVAMAPDCIGPDVERKIKELKSGDVILLENLRFYPAEENPEADPSFAENLAKWGDCYVNDAFGTAHRAHASTVNVARYFPHASAAGFLLEKEIQFLGKTLSKPERPFYAIIGGAKISTKIEILKALIKKVDALLIGGGMAYTFLKALGYSIGDSLCEDKYLDAAKEILGEGRMYNVQILLPIDHVIADTPVNGARTRHVDNKQGIPPGFMGVDIGKLTLELFKQALQKSRTIFWNGPLGIFEQSEFAKGTEAIARMLAELNATTIVGGGDSIAALHNSGAADKVTHISTGGGAALEYVQYGRLPGIDALTNASAVTAG